jgi:N6-adenosine-specific RNA methylase IME4
MNMQTTRPSVLATEAQTTALDAVLAHLPMADVEAETALRLSLAKYGQLAPVIRRAGQIVDGRRRVAALSALGRDPWVIDLPVDGNDQADAALLGRSFAELNGCRRELSIGVRAAIADTLATLRRGSNQHGDTKGASRSQAARTMGLSADTLDRDRRIKGVDDVQQKVLAGTMSLPQAVRTVEARKVAEKARGAVAPNGDLATCIDQLSAQGVSYTVVLADPAWNYDKPEPGTSNAEPALHYPTMPLEAIKALPVRAIAAKDSVLWMWTPNCLLTDALEVMKAWGFEYVSHAVWVKRQHCPTRSAILPTHEVLLMGRRGQGFRSAEPPMRSVFIDDQVGGVHSQKPSYFAQELERLYPDAAKVELFCRNARPGWAALGNQVVGELPDLGPAANDNEAPEPMPEATTAVPRRTTSKKTKKPSKAPASKGKAPKRSRT